MVSIRTIIVLLFSIFVSDAQEYQITSLVQDDTGTNSSGTFIPKFPPVTQSSFVVIPENLNVNYQGQVFANDIQSSLLNYVELQLSGPNQSFFISHGTGLYFLLPNNGTGDYWFTWSAQNNFNLFSTNIADFLLYNTNLSSVTCSGLSYTGAICNFQFPGLTGQSYFFSIYDTQKDFSNSYYWNDSKQKWAPIIQSLFYPNFFVNQSNGQGYIGPFPNGPLTNINVCAALAISNVPCIMTPPTNIYLTVLTNSINTFYLAGSVPTFVISSFPTNGYLTNLNGNSGQITYVETNGNALVDYFKYCTSNSTVCIKCADVDINIISLSQVNCGQCFNINNVNGGVITGNIYFNVGNSNQFVCIYYTNAACNGLQTNCAISDQYGNVKFFVHMCPGSSNYCIANIASGCTATEIFQHAAVAGMTPPPPSGFYDYNGDYYYNAAFSSSGFCQNGFYQLTNSMPQFGAEGLMWVIPGGFNINGNTAYVLISDNNFNAGGFGDIVAYATNSPNFNLGIVTGWIAGPAFSYTIPSAVAIDTYQFIQCCTTNCP